VKVIHLILFVEASDISYNEIVHAQTPATGLGSVLEVSKDWAFSASETPGHNVGVDSAILVNPVTTI
jgi:hypothetical protein